MGDPKKGKKKYDSPGHPYQKPRLEAELITVGKYGLRNKREIWRAQTKLRNYRAQARSFLALEQEEREKREKILVGKLARLGIVPESAHSDDILGLQVEAILNRRLQTRVLELGLAGTIHQARQLITHRHIMINDRIMSAPGYIVPVSDEDSISYAPNSPYNEPDHPMKKSLARDIGIVEIPKKEPFRGRQRR